MKALQRIVQVARDAGSFIDATLKLHVEFVFELPQAVPKRRPQQRRGYGSSSVEQSPWSGGRSIARRTPPVQRPC